jgi:regulator of RNase E activity RraA
MPRQNEFRDRLLRLDTAAISDAMDSIGVGRALFGILPRVAGGIMAGPAFTVQYQPLPPSRKGFQNAANYIDDVPAGSVVVVSNDGNTSCTNWGDILTNKAVSRGVAGTVINGSARDIETVRAHRYPLYSRGVFMVSGKNRVELKATNVRVYFDEVPVDPGDWIFGDDNGVVVIPADRLEEVITRAEAITQTEASIVASISAGESLAAARDRFGYAAPWDGPAKAEAQPSVATAPADFVAHWREQLDFVDIHYHADPDTYARKLNAIDAGKAYKALRGAVVLKSHLGCTCAVASLARSLGHPVFGSTSLNGIAGGLDVDGIKRSLCLRADAPDSARLVVDLPTVVSSTHESKLKRQFANSASAAFSQMICAITDAEGRLVPEIDALLDFCKDQPIVLTTGHSTRRQTEALIERCAKKGGVRLLLNQPANPITGLDAAALRALSTHDWLFVEQTALTYLLGYQSLEDFLEVLQSVSNLVYSSDLGQIDKMAPDAWRETSRGWFAEAGLGAERVREITLLNPLRMLAP